jgi:hypothetical protein
MHAIIIVALALAVMPGAHGAVVDFEDAGGKPCKSTVFKSCDTSTERAFKNTALMSKLFASLSPGDTLSVKNSTYLMMGGVYASNMTDITFNIDGTLLFSDDCDSWPTEKNGTSKMPVKAMDFENNIGFTITSSGTGTFDGNGAAWWGIPGVGYLTRGKNRPPLLSVRATKDFLMENMYFYQVQNMNFE